MISASEARRESNILLKDKTEEQLREIEDKIEKRLQDNKRYCVNITNVIYCGSLTPETKGTLESLGYSIVENFGRMGYFYIGW